LDAIEFLGPTAAAGRESLPEATVSVETVPTVRSALRRYLARIDRGELQPSVSEMVKLLDLERRLQAFETLEQLNALHDRPVDTGEICSSAHCGFPRNCLSSSLTVDDTRAAREFGLAQVPLAD
jgi:hypothetical protein